MSSTIAFRPRRLAHANLWVSDIERSIRFYESVLGIELVRRERVLRMGFHSNGNTHHDVGMIEISRGQDRYGRDGKLQIPKTRGTSVGLNHLGWEMTSEREVVEAYKRARQVSGANYRTVDHIISRSVYVPDPDGNMHEFYADSLDDWRTVFNLDLEDEVTAGWDPLASPPTDDHRYPVDPPIRTVSEAPLHPVRIVSATLGTHDLDRLADFYVDVAGLTLQERDKGEARFGGTAGHHDLEIVAVPEDSKTGLLSFAFALPDTSDVTAAGEALAAKGIASELSESPRGAALVLTDPDGFRIEFRNQVH